MTDLENREAFEKWFKKNFKDLHEAICCGDLVAKNYKKAMFKAWQASTQRQGFKFVPLEPSEETVKAIANYLCKTRSGTALEMAKQTYKAVMNVVET